LLDEGLEESWGSERGEETLMPGFLITEAPCKGVAKINVDCGDIFRRKP